MASSLAAEKAGFGGQKAEGLSPRGVPSIQHSVLARVHCNFEQNILTDLWERLGRPLFTHW